MFLKPLTVQYFLLTDKLKYNDFSSEGDCISGDAECPLPKCLVDGCCSSDPIAYFPTVTPTECLQSCVERQPGNIFKLTK